MTEVDYEETHFVDSGEEPIEEEPIWDLRQPFASTSKKYKRGKTKAMALSGIQEQALIHGIREQDMLFKKTLFYYKDTVKKEACQGETALKMTCRSLQDYLLTMCVILLIQVLSHTSIPLHLWMSAPALALALLQK